jgi:hypothetical protein
MRIVDVKRSTQRVVRFEINGFMLLALVRIACYYKIAEIKGRGVLDSHSQTNRLI